MLYWFLFVAISIHPVFHLRQEGCNLFVNISAAKNLARSPSALPDADPLFVFPQDGTTSSSLYDTLEAPAMKAGFRMRMGRRRVRGYRFQLRRARWADGAEL